MRYFILSCLVISVSLTDDTGIFMSARMLSQESPEMTLNPEDEQRLLRDVFYFRQLINENPNNSDHYFNLGLAALNLGKLETSAAAFEVGVFHRETDSEAYYNLGIIYARQQKYDRAAEAFETCIRLKPGEAKAHYNLGLTYRHQGRFVESVKTLAKAVELETGNPIFHFTRGSVEE
ncbi:uncharacterized protein METZ01_LOCUS173715, partial [marine metagenome]